MRNPLDTTPAYVVTTTATNSRGADFGTMRTVVTAGQLAQHALYMEPDSRAAERIAEGRHDTHVRTTDQFKAQLVALPVIVRTVAALPVPTVRRGDVVAIVHGEHAGHRLFDVVDVVDATDDTAEVAPVDPDDTREPFRIGLEQLHRVVDGVAFRRMLDENGRLIEGTWYSVRSYVTAKCSGRGPRVLGNPRHDLCHGWVAPLIGGARSCMCVCHDEGRMSFPEARALAADKVAATGYRRAVESAGGDLGADLVVSAADEWLAARMEVTRLGLDPAQHHLTALDEDLTTAYDIITRS